MARRRKKPAGCTNLNCNTVGCRKCAWNLRSGYSPFHVSAESAESAGKRRIKRPAWLALVVGVAAGLAGYAIWKGGEILAVWFVVAITVGLIILLRDR